MIANATVWPIAINVSTGFRTTNQTLVAYERSFGSRRDSRPVLQASYRTHGDHFLYDMRTPALFESRHRTHSAAVLVKSQWSRGERLLISYGGTAGMDAIASRNLGNHGYSRLSLFGEWKYALYAAGVLFFFVRIAGGWFLARRLVAGASRVACGNRAPVFESAAVATPMTTGIVSPCVLLPMTWRAGAALRPGLVHLESPQFTH